MPASPHARPAAGCRGHHLDGVGVRLRLVEVYLRVERLLANALALRRAQRDALKEVLYGGIELLGGHYPVDQPPVERGSRVDYIARKGHFRCPFPVDVPGDRHHRGMEEPATSAAGSGETGVLACHCEVGGCDQLAAGRGGEPMHTRHHRLGHLLDECHQFGAGDKQRTNRRQVGIGDIGEIVPGAEHRADARKDYAQGVTLPDVAEGCDQLAQCCSDRALRRCGRIIVTVANSPDRSTRMCSNPMAALLRTAAYAGVGPWPWPWPGPGGRMLSGA